MADKVEVAISPTTFNVMPGDTTEATVTLRNLGQSVDQFTISIDGIDLSWYTLPVSSVALFPNDQDKLRIILHPPKTREVKAGSYPLQIKVNSQENPEETATVELTIEIRALPELELNISPERITGRKGLYQITVKNPGDSAATLHLEASDDEGILQYSLQPESVNVPAGGWAESSLEVRLGWMAFFGGEKEFDFQVTASPLEAGQFAEEAKTINGQLVHIPWYKTLPKIRIPWLARPPVISTFKATTDDKREFKLSWTVKRATEVKLDGEDVDREGERLMRPAETTSYVLTISNKYGNSSPKRFSR